MLYIKNMQRLKAELEIEALLDRAVEELLLQENLLLERGRTSSGDGTPWSETLVGKLFGNIWKVVTLNGLLTDKFKDVIGVKSNLLKKLANKLEEAISKLPSEYLDRTISIDTDTRRLAFYTDIFTLFDKLQASDVDGPQALKAIQDFIAAGEEALHNLDLTQPEPAEFNSEVLPIVAAAKQAEKKLIKLDPKKKTNFPLIASSIADKPAIITKYNELSAKLKNVLLDSAKSRKVADFTGKTTTGSMTTSYKYKAPLDGEDDGPSGPGTKVTGATKSMYDIVAIVNKAHDLYTVHSDKDDKTVDERDPRLFKLWEKMVMKILSVKGDLIPLALKKYINGSLQEDFKKHEFKSDLGSKNILDELNNISSIISKVDKGEGGQRPITQKPDVAVFNSAKSTSSTIGYKLTPGVVVVRNNQFENSPIILKAEKGDFFLEDKRLVDMRNHIIAILPTQMTSAKVFTGIVSWSDDIFDKVKTTSGFNFDVDKMNIDALGSIVDNEAAIRALHIGEYYYAVFSPRSFSKGTLMDIVCYNPQGDMKRALADNKPAAKFSIVIDSVYSTMGLDGNIAYLDAAELKKIFGLAQQNFKLLDQHYKNKNA